MDTWSTILQVLTIGGVGWVLRTAMQTRNELRKLNGRTIAMETKWKDHTATHRAVDSRIDRVEGRLDRTHERPVS